MPSYCVSYHVGQYKHFHSTIELEGMIHHEKGGVDNTKCTITYQERPLGCGQFNKLFHLII